jgi:hypothetical protein
MSLKVTRGHRNAFAAHAQHIRDQFLSHDQLVRIHPVVAQQQPTAKLLFD